MAREDAARSSKPQGTWLVLVVTAICTIVVAYNTTAVITILPNLKSSFDLTPTAVEWTMAAYTVVGATFVPILGRLGDIIGKMKVFFVGMACFFVGSLTVVLAPDAAILLAGRGAQGAGAAALFGTSLAVLSAATPEAKRAGVLGVWGAMMGLGMSVGPIIGGAFAEYLNWRGVFVSDLILLAIAFLLGLRVDRRGYVPEQRKPGARLDMAGAVVLVVLLGPLAFALTYGEIGGWTSPLTLLLFVLAVAAAIALYITERRVDDPLIELHYFRHPRYLMATIGMFLGGFALFSFFVFFSLFVQSPAALGLSAMGAGAAILPLSGMMFIVSTTAPRVLAPVSFHWPISIGMACLVLGFLLLSYTSNSTGYGEIWWKLVIIGVGLGLAFSLLPRVGMRLLPEEHTGQGSGVINTCLYFGATLGSVVGGVVSATTLRAGLREVIAALPAGSTQREGLDRTLAHGTPSEVQQALAGLESPASAALVTALRDMQDNAFDNVMLMCTAAALIALVLALWLLRGPVPPLHSAARHPNRPSVAQR